MPNEKNSWEEYLSYVFLDTFGGSWGRRCGVSRLMLDVMRDSGEYGMRFDELEVRMGQVMDVQRVLRDSLLDFMLYHKVSE